MMTLSPDVLLQVFNTSLHSCSNTDYSVAVVALTSEGYSSNYSR